MPIKSVDDWLFITTDFSYREKYWPMISKIIKNEYGGKEIKIQSTVEEILKKGFQFFVSEFRRLVLEQRKASFFLYVHCFHENSIEFWKKQIKKESLEQIDENDLATERRVYKLILEQACEIDLVGTVNFASEINENKFVYQKILEELLYLGYWAYGFSDFIAQCQLIEKSTGISFDNNDLNILTYSRYKEVIDFVREDMLKHYDAVEIKNEVYNLIGCINASLGIDYSYCMSIANDQQDDFLNRLKVIRMDLVIDSICQELGCERDSLKDFYEGLTLSRNNKLAIEDSMLKSQEINRYIYRPILSVKIDNQDYCLIGLNKLNETITTLTTNAIPFGFCSKEWLKYPEISNYVKLTRSNHDEILEGPARLMLQDRGVLYDYRIESFKRKKGNNISILIKDVGEIDILFINKKLKILYVCECKHNRFRFDLLNWKRDYSNFKNEYENKLRKKVEWITANLETVTEHFQIHGQDESLDLKDYIVKGIFVINAPTFYMYNGNYRVFTLYGFKNLLDNKYINPIFRFKDEDSREVLEVHYPYFENLTKLLEH